MFGSGAAIGAIEVVSARPTEDFEGSVSGGLGNYSERRTRGQISGPLGDTAGGRLAFTYKQRDGFIKNIDGRPESQSPGKPAEALFGGPFLGGLFGNTGGRVVKSDTETLMPGYRACP